MTKETTSFDDLEPGMELRGTITRVELYGAFADVGAEQPGLIHISRLKKGNVKRTEEVVNPGDEITAWVQTVDAEKGRLELTMIKPVKLNWKDINPGLRTSGSIVRIENYGAFVDIGAERPGLIHVSELSDEYVSNPADLVNIGQVLEVEVIEVDRKKRQIRLSRKAILAAEFEPDEEEVMEELPTAMEIALRSALEQNGDPFTGESGDQDEQEPKKQSQQEDLLSRTLENKVETSNTSDSS